MCSGTRRDGLTTGIDDPGRCRSHPFRHTFRGVSDYKDSVLRDLEDRAASRKFEARHGDVPVASLGDDIIDDYPPGWLEARYWSEEEFRPDMETEYWQAMEDYRPAISGFY